MNETYEEYFHRCKQDLAAKLRKGFDDGRSRVLVATQDGVYGARYFKVDSAAAVFDLARSLLVEADKDSPVFQSEVAVSEPPPRPPHTREEVAAMPSRAARSVAEYDLRLYEGMCARHETAKTLRALALAALASGDGEAAYALLTDFSKSDRIEVHPFEEAP